MSFPTLRLQSAPYSLDIKLLPPHNWKNVTFFEQLFMNVD